jgi:hemerythrin
MALLTWNNAYSVKIKEIDLQHQKLIEMVNELHDFMKQGKGKEAVGKILKELASYTVYHFQTEEKMFAKHLYPETNIHTQQHKDLLDEVTKLISDYEKGDGILPMDLLDFLKDWLVNHIGCSDKKYTLFFTSRGIL